ncbi:MAG: hypothetical protein P1U64_00475 [Alcanivoracaceae bacterium]|nr:hypothetical protein [Alcanivoracaceae bacterium]
MWFVRRFLVLTICLVGLLGLAGCGGDSSSNDYPVASKQKHIKPEGLAAAAAFLGAAAGKQTPVTMDTVVFLNSVLRINDVPTDPQNLYGDLWSLLRDIYGRPVLDSNGCVQPLASQPLVWPDLVVRDTVPMVVEEYQDGVFTCTVMEGFEPYTVELEIGRLNMVRSVANNPDVLARGLREVINNINASESISLDASGRLVLLVDDGGELVEQTIDAPRENLAIYHALMTQGRIAGYGPTHNESGEMLAPEWLEIRRDLDMGDLAFLRDGRGGVPLRDGYADVSAFSYSRQKTFQDKWISFVQYIEGADCPYWDFNDYAWRQVFDEEPYVGSNMAGFTRAVDDTRRVIVFVHDVIQDVPETDIQTLPTPAGSRMDMMHATAAFLGGASNKSVPLTVDGLVFINTVLGLNDSEFAHKGEAFGDLWALLRNDNGEPLLDANSCPQPIASEPVVWPDLVERNLVPMQLDENNDCEIVPGYEDAVVEIELGRLNGVRVALTNPDMLNRALYDVVNSINASEGLKMDVSGRLAYGVMVDGELMHQTIDSPRAGLAMYWAMMRWGKLEGQVDIMEDGNWVTKDIAVTLDDAILDAEGLGYLKHGTAACQGDPMECGYKQLASGYVDYSQFSHSTEDVYSGVNVDYVERQDEMAVCGYQDQSADVWERILGSDAYVDTNIGAFVKQAEDTRTVISFIHTVIQDPLP